MTEFVQLADRWEIIGPIGDNPGMSTVFEVARGGERAVVKRVRKFAGGDRDLLVMDLENCRNVVPIVETGEDDDELLLRMPKAETSLNQRLVSVGKFSEADAVQVLIDVTTALEDMGNVVVHRDIKPQNILLYQRAWSLTDFGIARYVEDATRTQTYKLGGSEAWIAPERYRLERATIKSDVYSLGIVAYQLVTGTLPFHGPDFRDQHMNQPPTFPGDANASSLLRTLIIQMLAKSPAARPTPRHILERLDQINKPVSSPALSRLYELAGKSAENKATAGAAAASAQTKREQRQELATSAVHLASEFITPLADQLSSVPGLRKIENTNEIQFSFEAARMTLRLPKYVSRPEEWPEHQPFDVVCAGAISIEMTHLHDQWAGREHSLWYCDAQSEGEYHWFETAFHNMRDRRRLEPYNNRPSVHEAQVAVQRVISSEQVAVPFTALVGETVGLFIERWTTWFTQAAEGSLSQPDRLPEGNVSGSYRN